MCGIVGYTGTRPALPILLHGLEKLEYRGYDSAGVALCVDGGLDVVKAVGKVGVLSEKLDRLRLAPTFDLRPPPTSLAGGGFSAVIENQDRELPSPSGEGPGVGCQDQGRVRVRVAATGIAHTRWATHGGVTEANAHPHVSADRSVAIVHNGIVENDRALRAALIADGVMFSSETDSEVIAQLIASKMNSASGPSLVPSTLPRPLPWQGGEFSGEISKDSPLIDSSTQRLNHKEAIISALQMIHGTYGLVVAFKDDPSHLYVARMGSPIVIGKADDGAYVASDPNAILSYTRDVIYLDDGELAVISSDGSVEVERIGMGRVDKSVTRIDWSEEEAQKGGHPHFMLKEILEQPDVIRNAIRGRIALDEGTAKLGGLAGIEDKLRAMDRLIIVGCGTAYNAGLVGEYMIEELAGIPVEVECASEFRYRNPVLAPGTAVLAISQSGETADTLAAIREAKRHGLLTLGIVNAVGSTIARETDAGVYNHAGPEIGVASTKAFTSQLAVLALLTLALGRMRAMSYADGRRFAEALISIPLQMERILARRAELARIAARFEGAKSAFFLGRKYLAPLAEEGALKLKEISYIHAEGYAAGEMKHGAIALIEPGFPSVVCCPKDSVYEKTLSNIREIKSRQGTVIAITTESNFDIHEHVDDSFDVPVTIEPLQPLLMALPLQLLAYEAAVARGYDPDKPRNLAKSVTVE